MNEWESILKERLEGYQESLPEGSLADFHRRRAQVRRARKRMAAVWVSAASLAAGLAAFLLLRQPGIPAGVKPVEREYAALEAAPSELLVRLPSELPVIAVPHRKASAAVELPQEDGDAEEAAGQAAETPFSAAETPSRPAGNSASSPEEASLVGHGVSAETFPSPFVPMQKPVREVRLRTGITAGSVLGAGAAGTLLAALLNRPAHYPVVTETDIPKNPAVPEPEGNGTSGIDVFFPGSDSQNPPVTPSDPAEVNPADPPAPAENSPRDQLVGKHHHLPLKTGLSVRFGLSPRLHLTTGITYSLYTSRYTYSLSGEKGQAVHYLGFPLRLDWTAVSGKHLEVYFGGGVEGDFCVGATRGEERLREEGLNISLVGTGGVQWNLSRHVGLYLEPGVSWLLPQGKTDLETYRKDHPFLFSFNTGLRINIK